MTVKVFDESVKDEVIKALNRCEMDIEVQMEGKDIRVKLGQGKKDHQVKALQTIKEIHDKTKIELRKVRQGMKPTLQKLKKVAGKDEVQMFEDELEKMVKSAE